MADEREKWDQIYRRGSGVTPTAARVLRDNEHLLNGGRGLEIACGLGANALLLAARGVQTEAWDISPVAIDRLRALAQESGLPLQGVVRDVAQQPPESESYDVIVVTHFLERALAPHIIAALRPGGLLFYQTFTRTRVSDAGPKNEAFRLATGELLMLFAPLRIVVYREEGRLGDLGTGFRGEALLVAQKKGKN